jgi:predicted dehydrogenase
MAWEMSSKKDGYEYTVEDFASALVRFDNGFTLQVEASFNLNIPRDLGKIELFGTKSGAKIDPGVELYTDMAGMFVNIQPQGNTTFDATNPFNAEIRGFINAAMNGGECRATAEDGVALMKILDAIYESAATGKSVDIR